MSSEHEVIDISHSPDLLQLAEEVRRRNTPAVLRHGDEDVAVIMPLADGATRTAKRSPIKKRSAADLEAFLSSAGGWKDLVDTEKLKRDIAESRARSSRPPVTL